MHHSLLTSLTYSTSGANCEISLWADNVQKVTRTRRWL